MLVTLLGMVTDSRLLQLTKCSIINARHAVRDGDRLKAATIRKGIFPNACHAVRDGDRLKAATTINAKSPMLVTLLGIVTD